MTNTAPTRTRPESAPTPEPCPCSAWYPNLSPEQHDWLLTVEERGIAGLLEVFDMLNGGGDDKNPEDGGRLAWYEFEEWVAAHNWRDPAVMFRWAGHIEMAIRRRTMPVAAVAGG